jgi:hypothetical protein
MTTETTNDDRARWAGAALKAFMAESHTDEEKDPVGDLLTYLMHWCDRNNFDFELALQRAQGHYEEETAEDGIATRNDYELCNPPLVIHLSPSGRGNQSNLSVALHALRLGDSILVKAGTKSRVANICQCMRYGTNFSKKFSCRTITDGIVVRRVL